MLLRTTVHLSGADSPRELGAIKAENRTRGRRQAISQPEPELIPSEAIKNTDHGGGLYVINFCTLSI